MQQTSYIYDDSPQQTKGLKQQVSIKVTLDSEN